MPSVIRLKSSAYQSVPFSFGYGATCDVPAKVAEALEVGVNHAVSVRPHAVRMRMPGAPSAKGWRKRWNTCRISRASPVCPVTPGLRL